MTSPSETLRLSFTLNGRPWQGLVHPEATLLEVLRTQAGVLSVKDGCSGQGACGCCTVLVDGSPRLSCTLAADRAEGREVVTLEGLPATERAAIAEAFARAGAVQCGFCTPGIALRMKALLDRTPEPAEAAIRKELDKHLCRCTGYVKIVDAVKLMAAGRRGEPLPEADASGRVGTAMTLYQARELTLGERPFVDDLAVPGLLEGALCLARVPRAKVLSIDLSAAKAVEGVVAVVTAADVPGQRFQGLIERDWPVFTAVGEEVRYVGDVLAAVAATTRRAAREAAAAIRVELEPLPPVTDPEEALCAAARIAEDRGNVLWSSVARRGDAEAALASSAHVAHETFRTQFIEHAFLEPESAVAIPPAEAGDRFKVLSPGQGVADERRQLASLLGLGEEQVEVELVPAGGAFGGKEDLGVQGHAAVLAHVTGRPCRVTLSREESILTHPKRHPMKMEYWVGCDAEGRLTAVKARIVGDTGAYASVGGKVLERACGHATSAYRVPNVDIEALAVFTNNPPCGAMRGFGVGQTAFAMEGCLDRLAEKVGLDGWELRWRNVLEEGDRFGKGQKLHAVGLKKTLLAVKDAYRSARYAGIACGLKNVGIGHGMEDAGQVELTVLDDGRVRLATGFTEMGQGLFTVLIQLVCEETGLPPEVFEAITTTARPVPCGMTTASRATVLAGNAAVRAGKKLREAMNQVPLGSSAPEPTPGAKFAPGPPDDWSDSCPRLQAGVHGSAVPASPPLLIAGSRAGHRSWQGSGGSAPGDPGSGPLSPCKARDLLRPLAGQRFLGEWVCDWTTELADDAREPVLHLTYGFASQVVILDGDGNLERVVSAVDCGRVMNPMLLSGQLEGSVHMGLGQALSEELVIEGGVPRTTHLGRLGILRASAMPPVECIFVEEREPNGPHGAKGVGEIGLVPTAGAVAGALHAFDGVFRASLPMRRRRRTF